MNQRNRKKNDNWFLIEAKDRSRRGYWFGKNSKDACLRFGLKPEQCSVKRVIRTEKGFIEQDLYEQGEIIIKEAN